MTTKMKRLLEILDHYSGHGTIEVETQFGEYDGETEADLYKGWRITRFVVAGLMRHLIKKGLATNDGCYEITDAGRALVAKWKTKET